MHAHLRKTKIEDLISEHTDGFEDASTVVEISTGEAFKKSMRLRTNFFIPKDTALLRQDSIAPASAAQDSQLVQMDSVPVGILGFSLSEMKKTCRKYIEDMISDEAYAEQCTAGNVSQIPRQILNIVTQYCMGRDDVSTRSPPHSDDADLNPLASPCPERIEAPCNPLLHGLPTHFFGAVCGVSVPEISM